MDSGIRFLWRIPLWPIDLTVILMNKFFTIVVFLALGIGSICATVFARGFGGFGGFHGGGFSGGFDRGSFGGGGFDRGSYGGGFDRSSYGGFDRSSYSGGFDRSSYGGVDRSSYGTAWNRSSYGGVDRSSYGSGFANSGARAGGFSDYGGSVNRGQLNSFLGLPTDGGFHAANGAYGARGLAAGPDGAAAYRGGATGHVYQGPEGTTVAHGAAGVQGAAVGPGGAAAGGRYASGTVVKGPEGNTFAHETTAGRGVAAGPDGVTAGHHAASGTAVNGTAVAGRSYAAYGYGTHAWSPTYCHAQAVAGRGWFGTSGIYTGSWCAAHPWAWYPAGFAAADWAAAAWATTTWATVGPWIGIAAEPYSYNYGNDIVYDDGNVYYGGQPAGTSQQYYQEAVSLAGAGANAEVPSDAQWLPLGVFGLMADGKKTPDMVFQLAVDKQGAIRGNYYDKVTQANLPVTGQIDKKNQRAAWSVSANGKQIVVETGLYNLTQNESTALVHFGADDTQQELLVRVKQPDQESQ